MVLFPMSALKSLANAGVATVAFAAIAALLVTPAAIVLLGDRLSSLDVRRLVRRILRRPPTVDRPVAKQPLYRWTKFVMRHALWLYVSATALLIILALPIDGVQLGISDDRMLPTSASARQVGDQMRNDYPRSEFSSITVVIPDTSGIWKADLDRYSAELSRVADVSSVSSPGGTFVAGVRAGPPTAGTGMTGGAAFLTIDSKAPPLSAASEIQLDRLHAITGPTGLFGGLAQINRDNIAAITRPLPWVLAVAGTVMLVLLFSLTGSVVVPLKALLLNILSLTATVGALVWVFQDGHLGALGTTSIGALPVIVPVPLLCIVFALSMDYEVFLVSRIREYWLESGRTQADNDESVALGLARGGRVVTAAAVLMAIPFAAQIGTSVLRIFGVGLTFAILMDATVVRMVMLPAFMRLLGKWNWWAPKPLANLYERLAPAGHPAKAHLGP
jgi:RND superfamily putative drug exporter